MASAVIFDFDGILADTEVLHFKAYKATLDRFEAEFTKEIYWDKYLGYTDSECYEYVSQNNDLSLSKEQIAGLVKEKEIVFNELAQEENIVFSGVFEFLNLLRDNSIPVSICSGAALADIKTVFKTAEATFKENLLDRFTAIVAAEDVEKGKPFPDGYLLAIEKMNEKLGLSLCGEDCVAVEDSHWGLESAKAANMATIAVTNSYSKDELSGKADVVVANLNELEIGIVREIQGSL